MKRYVKADYTSYNFGPRNSKTRSRKQKRGELYDRIHDIIEMLGDAYSDDAIAMNIFARGPKGNRINAFRFESTTETEDRWRFNKEEAEDVMKTALDIVDELGIADRCDVYIVSETILGKLGYNVIIDVALDPNIDWLGERDSKHN